MISRISDVELIYQLTERMNFTIAEAEDVILELWEWVVNHSDFGYGQDDKIIESLNKIPDKMKAIINKG